MSRLQGSFPLGKSFWGGELTQHFYQLGINEIFLALEQLGLKPTGRIMPLNSMENRVYEVEVSHPDIPETSSQNFLVIKFYRPGRWSENQIREEHQFLRELAEEEIPVICPIDHAGETLFTLPQSQLHYSIFPKKGGRAPDELNEVLIQQIGTTLARIHIIGRRTEFHHRLVYSSESMLLSNLEFLQKNHVLPLHLKKDFIKIISELSDHCQDLLAPLDTQRIHGDCHFGNWIKRDSELLILDFDDCMTGPVIHDLWSIIPGKDNESIAQRNLLLSSYQNMYSFRILY